MKRPTRMTFTARGRARAAVFASCMWVIAFAPFITVAQNQAPPVFSSGQVQQVTSTADATESYTLYLPTAYSATKHWPIIYFFDPEGRGRRPIDLYKDLAEEYGFILAGSNNSRNFSGDQSKAVNALWQDTHARLSLDEHRSYASGFSGGARVAGAVALSGPPGQIAGVIAHGAGYPSNRVAIKDELPYFFAVGDQDFNWPEVTNIRREREEQGLPYRVRVFHGRHQWAPTPVMEDAIEYMNLKAIEAGHLATDAGLVERVFEKLKSEAADAETKKDPIAQLNAYRALASDLAGLRDTKEAAGKLAALEQSASLKAALRDEREQIAEQLKIEQEISPKIDAFADKSAPDVLSLGLEIRQQMGALHDQAKHAKNERKQLISRRALNGIFVGAMEEGQLELENRHFEKAEAYFDLMRQVTEDPWPALLLAEAHASDGNRKLAIKDLEEAVRRGLKDRTVIESDTKLKNLKGDPGFEKLVAALPSEPAEP